MKQIKQITTKLSSALGISSLLLTAPLAFGEDTTDSKTKRTPYTAKNNSWISLSGTVTSSGPHSFVLDYGKGSITVEMDDYDWYADGYKILNGDEVTVYGDVDADPLEVRTIEAGSVWVKGLNTYFYANSDDEEDFISYMNYDTVFPSTGLSGEITKIDGRDFILKTASGLKFRVSTEELGYNPLDNKGFQKVTKGDRVWISGLWDKNYFEKSEIDADTLITLQKG